MIRRILKGAGILLLALIVAAGGYAAYVFIDYHRLPDEDVALTPEDGEIPAMMSAGESYEAMTWNLGFGAYSADYGFFMDGGSESRAYSREAVYENIGHAVEKVNAVGAELKLLQEVDIGSTRTYQVDETRLICDEVGGYAVFAQNYDSPYLFYPLTKPHGASKSGLLTISDFWISRQERVSLPVETGFMKLLDLDRCYSVSHIPVDNGRELCLYNLHLSAYTSDGSIATRQLELLTADMLSEYQAGNYAIAGGDYNKDLLGNSSEVFGVSGEAYTWAQPLPEGVIPEGLTLVNSLDAEDPVPSNRVADGPYRKGETFVSTLDGFIVSDNVNVSDCRVIDDGFACSDHNPVVMSFELAE